MPSVLLLFVSLGVAGLFIGLFIYRQFQLRERTIDEVIIFLRKIDWDELAEIYNVGAEGLAVIFADSDYTCFRRSLRVRIHTAREFAWRMYNNARVVQQWATTELADVDLELDDRREEQAQKIRQVVVLATEARAILFMQLIKLTTWTVLRADRWPRHWIPSVAGLRKWHGQPSLDVIELYSKLKVTAADLARRYGQQFYDEVLGAF
ncbi:MAG: hypothetical protein JWQ87_5267 [Candidatus Sulfotelmatobacter sp.]|nr:hypothetical protein [Candidatus Sulfotelmatobacter sp.]